MSEELKFKKEDELSDDELLEALSGRFDDYVFIGRKKLVTRKYEIIYDYSSDEAENIKLIAELTRTMLNETDDDVEEEDEDDDE